MGEAEKRLYRCCFAGHRPERTSTDENTIRRWLEQAIRQTISEGFRTYITGMARGADIIAAEIVLDERERHPDIRLICAIPHPDFEKSWGQHWQRRYNAILSKADLIKIISDNRSMKRLNDSYQIRNEWMVDHAAKIICVYNGLPSGTRNTLIYAKRKGLAINCIRVQS